jgi:hypothetical protein
MTDDCSRGDFDPAKAAFCSDRVIIEELAPYQWFGPGFVWTGTPGRLADGIL